jgi:hypothetical protein
MDTKALAPVAGLALLVGVACSGGDDEPAGPAPTPASEETTTTAGADAASDEDGGSGSGDPVGAEDPDDPAASDRPAGQGAAAATPAPVDLDVEMRHPAEIVLRVSRLSFEGDDVVVDAEIINSSRNEVTFHPGNWSSGRLRLVDDAGQEYNFVEPAEDEPILLTPGETVTGSLAFRGPLQGEPAVVRMVNNVHTGSLDTWSPDDETEGSTYPVFVVPIELTWT